MTTKVKSYRIDIQDDAQQGDAIVIGQNGGMTTSHLGTVSSCDIGSCCGNIPVLAEGGKISCDILPVSAMTKNIYDPQGCNADAFDYCNFCNTPIIPEVYDPVITFTQGGVTKGSISLNQASPTVIPLDAGGVTAGCAIDIYNSKVSVKYDGTTIGKNNCNEICVVDYDTIKGGAACGATAVQANDLATVAMSGKYCDLEGKPEIPSAQIQSDWAQTNTNLADYIKNKPTIGNATITLQKNGTDVDTFTLNQTANKCLNLVLDKCDVGLNNVDNTSDADKPVSNATLCALACKQDNIDDLNTIRCNACAGKTASETIANYGDIVSHNVCEFATATQGGKADSAVQPGDLCTVATSGKYCDLSGKPVLCDVATSGKYCDLSGTPLLCAVATSAKYCDLIDTPNLATVATTGCYGDLCGIPDLCTVATTGKYCDLSGTPNLCTVATSGKYCDLSGTPLLCTVATTGAYSDLIGKPNEVTTADMVTGTSTVLGVVSAKGVADYVSCRVSNLYKYKGNRDCYCDLPGTGNTTGDTYNVKCAYGDYPAGTNYSWNGTDWDPLGGSIDLSGYAECCDIPTDNCQLSNSCGYTTCTGTVVASDLNPYAKSCTLCTVATSGKYCDLTGTPTIPTDNCQLSNSCGYTTCTGTVVASDLNAYAKCCDLKTVATSGKYCDLDGLPTIPTDNCQLSNGCGYTTCTGTLVACDLNPYVKSCSLCTVATSGCYCDLGGTPSLATVATTGCYNDLTGTPTIPTKVSQLSNDCNYIDNTVNNLTNYTPTCSLANVATSGAYCDLSGTPSLACVACSGSYEDLCCKPNLGVYQTTACMVCSLTGADDNHYPSAKTVADALSCAGAGDMLSTMYDPNGKCADTFDYSNFINTPNLCTVATSGKYCDLTGTPTIPAALSAGCATSISSNKINVNYDGDTIKKNSGNCLYVDLSAGKGLELANNTISATNVYNINQSDITVTTDDTKGVAPYNTSYGYTNFTISANAGVKWIEGAVYIFNMTEDNVVSANRNARVRIGDGAYIPIMGPDGAIVDGRYSMNKNYNRVFVYKTSFQSGGALHYNTDTSYSATTVAAIAAGTSTSSKVVSAQVLNQGITCLAVAKNAAAGQTITSTSTSATTALSLTASATSGSSYIAFNGCGGYLGSFGVDKYKTPQFYNGTSHTLAYISGAQYSCSWDGVADTAPSQNAVYDKIESVVASIPTDNCQLTNGCGYITNSDINTKAFTLSSTSDTTNASAAVTYINGGGNAIILYNNQAYTLSSKGSTQIVFKGQTTATANTSDTSLSQSTLTFTVSGNNVSAISATATSLGSYLETNRNYGTAFTPTCSGHPATKKYVDDNLSCYVQSCTLCTVATSGKYCDLTGTPTIPTVGNATITLTQGGNSIGSFTTNSNTNNTIDFEYGICYICCSCASCYSSCCDNRTYIIYE